MRKNHILKAISLLTALCIAAGCSGSTAAETTAESTISVISEIAEPEVDYVDEFDYTYYKNPTIWTTDKIFEELTINGQKFEAPLTLEKLGEGYSHSTDGGFYDSNKRIACLRLMYNGKSLAWVYFDDCDSIDDVQNKNYNYIVFSANDIDNEYTHNVSINEIELFSSYKQLLEKMGVPAVDDGYNKNYTSDNEAVENQNFSYNDYSVKFYVFDDKVLMISINLLP